MILNCHVIVAIMLRAFICFDNKPTILLRTIRNKDKIKNPENFLRLLFTC